MLRQITLPFFIIFFILLLVCFVDFSLAAEKRPYTIVLLPDTQKYKLEDRSSRIHIFESQTRWIADHIIDKNIVLVLHLGDVVDYSDSIQWYFASRSLSILNGVVPYILAVGNHDIASLEGTKDTDLFNKYFKVRNFEKFSSLQGTFKESHLENSYYLFDFQGDKYLILSLLYCPNDQILNWANKIISTHSKPKVIVVTHSYLGKGNKHVKPGDKENFSDCGTFWPGEKGNEGKEIWEKLIRKHSNMLFVFSGHLYESRLVSKGFKGNRIFQVTTNYQNLDNGGNGFLRLLTFFPDEQRVFVQTYSPFLDEYLEDPKNRFEIDLTNGKFLPVK